MIRRILAFASPLALAACATPPAYHMPLLTAPAATGAFQTAAPVVTAEARDDWWRLYDDPVLDRLIADALAANADIRVAVARLDRARASLREARSDRLPQTQLSAEADRRRLPEIQRLPGLGKESTLVDAGLSVSYELDLSGRVRNSIAAARGDTRAAEADADAVRVAIVADTTRAYVDAAAAAQRLAVARDIVKLLDDSARVTSRRQEVGRAARLDVIRIAALRDQRAAEIPTIEAERQAALFRLATLTGRAPADLPPDAAARTTPPTLTSPIPVGDGRALLARRPDIRAAEQRLAAGSARVGVATSELYPSIRLGGSIGSTSMGLGDLFGGGPLRWLLGSLISWNFPNQEAARARIAGAKADVQADLATFDGTVLRALQETETALSSYARALDRRTALAAARDEADRAARVAQARQREGTLDFLDMLDAERTSADAAAALADADTRIADAQVDLFRALGGGWKGAAAAGALPAS